MTITSPFVSFSLYDSSVKQDSTASASSIQLFSKIEDIELLNSNTIYGSFEPNFWLLDGKFRLMPTITTDVHVGWMSMIMSDVASVFSVPPVLIITFGSVQSVDGLTLNFSQFTDDWCNNIDVAYYDAADTLIQTDNYAPATYEFYTAKAAVNFKKIVVTFNSTNKPYRYLRLTSIDYGQIIHFSGSSIKSCNIIEEINPLSNIVPIGVLELTVFSSNNAFSIVDLQPPYNFLNDKSVVIDVYQTTNSTPIYMGRFYLKTWESLSAQQAKFTAEDIIGILDKMEIPEEYVLNNDIINAQFSVGELIQRIFDITLHGLEYEIAVELYNIDAYGWVKSNSCRETLQQLAFVGGAYITCSRSNKIQVRMMELAYDTSETEIDDRDVSLVYTGTWIDVGPEPRAYLTTLKSMTVYSVYPNAYFTFSFSGTGFIIHYAAEFGTPAHDRYGKFYVSIDGGSQIMIEDSGTYSGEFHLNTWESPILTNKSHTVVVYGWVFGDEGEGNSTIYFDAVTTISPIAAVPDYNITNANKGENSVVSLLPRVTGVELVSHQYTYDGLGNVLVYSATLVAGTYKIRFEEPLFNYSVSGGTQVAYNIDWIIISVAAAGVVTVTARKYVDSQSIYSVYDPSVATGDEKNVIKITDVPLVNPKNAQAIVNRIYAYYQQRYLQKMKLYSSEVKIGDSILINTYNSRQIGAIVEKITLDLAGGFIEQVEAIGVVNPL